MKRTLLKRLSPQKKCELIEEQKIVKELLEICKGMCMNCGKKPDWLGLQKSHTKDRKKFILVCVNCHSPEGKHQYLKELIKIEKEVENETTGDGKKTE